VGPEAQLAPSDVPQSTSLDIEYWPVATDCVACEMRAKFRVFNYDQEKGSW
jgi:hypothetical protein